MPNTARIVPATVTTQRASAASSQPLSPELETLVLNCKAVVPQVPLDVLRKDILKTKVRHGLLQPPVTYTCNEGIATICSQTCVIEAFCC